MPKLNQLQNGFIITPSDTVIAMVVSADVRDGKRGQYITGSIRDKEIAMDAKVWSVTGTLAEDVSSGKIIEITSGKVTEWEGSLQIAIDSVNPVSIEQAVALDIIPAAAESKEELLDAFAVITTEYVTPYNSRLDNLIQKLQQSSVWEKFINMPAAKGMHHAYRHGLLEHSVNTASLSISMADYLYHGSQIDIPVMATAALFHDIGKVLEYNLNSIHMIEEFGINGAIMGHLFMGASLIRNMVRSMDPEEAPTTHEVDKISHIILSHHNFKSDGWGSVADPSCIEAFIVSQADNLEAKLNAISHTLLDKPKGKMFNVAALGGKKFMNL